MKQRRMAEGLPYVASEASGTQRVVTEWEMFHRELAP